MTLRANPSKMIKLDDKQIRSALKGYLTKTSPVALLEEVRVHNGNAIADVVAIHDVAHCYEIKGETDEIRRISKQGAYYDLSFIKTTLVTTENHLALAKQLAPAHWGLLLAKPCEGVVVFKMVRQARNSSLFDKQLALLTLWKSELLTLCSDSIYRADKLSRATLSMLIAEEKNARDITLHIGDLLAKRHLNNEWSLTI
jgi:hypothetical protein